MKRWGSGQAAVATANYELTGSCGSSGFWHALLLLHTFPRDMQRAGEANAGFGLGRRRCIAWRVWGRDSGDRHLECKKRKRWQDIFRVSMVSVLAIGFISDEIC